MFEMFWYILQYTCINEATVYFRRKWWAQSQLFFRLYIMNVLFWKRCIFVCFLSANCICTRYNINLKINILKMKKSTGCYVIECNVKISKKIACISEILLFFVCKDISELLKVQRNMWNLKHNYNSKIIWHKQRK